LNFKYRGWVGSVETRGMPSESTDLGQELLGQVPPHCRRGERLAPTLHLLDPFLHDPAKLRIDCGLVVTVAARPNDAGALADETAILVRPLDELDVSGTVFHDLDSPMALLTSCS
jgi:hypothetical protein